MTRIPILALAAMLVGCAQAPPEREPIPSLVEQGRELFLHYCATCHGLGAQGDGPAALALTRPPADLTRIALRNGGGFPESDVAFWIDGRFDVAAHGSREMPVWGSALRQELPETSLEQEIVRGQIGMLVDYLRSIQVSTPGNAR